MLKDKEPGSFIVRDSHSFRGAYGLAMKVATPPPSVLQLNKKGRDPGADREHSPTYGVCANMALSFFGVSVFFQRGPLRTVLVQATSLMICEVYVFIAVNE